MKILLILLFAIFVCLSQTAVAQTGNVFVVQTFKTVIPEGGSAAERDSLYSEWYERMAKKNDKIVSRKDFRHYFGQDSRDWVVITEYRNLADFEASESVNSELAQKAWPDSKKRAEFFRKFLRYFEGGHSDEVYRQLTKFGK